MLLSADASRASWEHREATLTVHACLGKSQLKGHASGKVRKQSSQPCFLRSSCSTQRNWNRQGACDPQLRAYEPPPWQHSHFLTTTLISIPDGFSLHFHCSSITSPHFLLILVQISDVHLRWKLIISFILAGSFYFLVVCIHSQAGLSGLQRLDSGFSPCVSPGSMQLAVVICECNLVNSLSRTDS